MALGAEKRLQRRLDVLATARQLIAARGYDGVTMRDLAEAAGVTVATLYNRFGSKNGLLIAAVEEVFREVIDPAIHAADLHGFDLVLAGALRTSNIIEVEPGFPRALAMEIARDLAGSRKGGELRTAFRSMHRDQVRRGLEEMRHDSALVDWADLDAVTEVILLQTSAATAEWALNGQSPAWLRSRCGAGASLVVLGLAVGPARGLVAETARQFMRGEAITTRKETSVAATGKVACPPTTGQVPAHPLTAGRRLT